MSPTRSQSGVEMAHRSHPVHAACRNSAYQDCSEARATAAKGAHVRHAPSHKAEVADRRTTLLPPPRPTIRAGPCTVLTLICSARRPSHSGRQGHLWQPWMSDPSCRPPCLPAASAFLHHQAVSLQPWTQR